MKLVKNIFILVVTLILILFLLEGIFRFFRKQDALRLSMGRVDTKYHHTYEPHSTIKMVSSIPGEYDSVGHVNNFGFRGPDMTLEKAPGVKRIFVVGDSFTLGVGANDNETIPAFLQNDLDSARKKYEIVNAGRSNTSPLIYYMRLRDEIPKFKPDVVVMMLDFSDLWEDWRFEQNLIYDSAGQPERLSPYYMNGRFHFWDFLRFNSVFLSYVHNKVVRTFLEIQKIGWNRYVHEVILQRKRAKAVIATISKDDTIEFDGQLFLRGSARANEIETHFKRTSKYILMSKQLAEQSGAKFLLVMYPYGIQVGPDQWAKGRVFWGYKEGEVSRDMFSFNLVEKFARENNIPFINLLDDVRRHADQKLYYDYDGHLNPAANRIVAKALSEKPAFQAALK